MQLPWKRPLHTQPVGYKVTQRNRTQERKDNRNKCAWGYQSMFILECKSDNSFISKKEEKKIFRRNQTRKRMTEGKMYINKH